MTVSGTSENDAREALVVTMRRMHANGLNRGTSGNASVRAPGGMLITPSGVAPDALTPDTMVLIAPDGACAKAGPRPSTEFKMHQRILESRPDAHAVVHCHSRYATILACCNRPIEPLHYMLLVARAPCVNIAPLRPSALPSSPTPSSRPWAPPMPASLPTTARSPSVEL